MENRMSRALIASMAAAVMVVFAMCATMVAASSPVAFGRGLEHWSQGSGN